MTYAQAAKYIAGVRSRAVAVACVDGYLLSCDDMRTLQIVGKWLHDGAIEREPRRILPADTAERIHIEAVLERCGGNAAEAARHLGIHKSTITRKRQMWALADLARFSQPAAAGQPSAESTIGGGGHTTSTVAHGDTIGGRRL